MAGLMRLYPLIHSFPHNHSCIRYHTILSGASSIGLQRRVVNLAATAHLSRAFCQSLSPSPSRGNKVAQNPISTVVVRVKSRTDRDHSCVQACKLFKILHACTHGHDVTDLCHAITIVLLGRSGVENPSADTEVWRRMQRTLDKTKTKDDTENPRQGKDVSKCTSASEASANMSIL
jgi:hypothetical protein